MRGKLWRERENPDRKSERLKMREKRKVDNVEGQRALSPSASVTQ